MPFSLIPTFFSFIYSTRDFLPQASYHRHQTGISLLPSRFTSLPFCHVPSYILFLLLGRH